MVLATPTGAAAHITSGGQPLAWWSGAERDGGSAVPDRDGESLEPGEDAGPQELTALGEAALRADVLRPAFGASIRTGGYPRSARSYGLARMSSSRTSRASRKHSRTSSEGSSGVSTAHGSRSPPTLRRAALGASSSEVVEHSPHRDTAMSGRAARTGAHWSDERRAVDVRRHPRCRRCLGGSPPSTGGGRRWGRATPWSEAGVRPRLRRAAGYAASSRRRSAVDDPALRSSSRGCAAPPGVTTWLLGDLSLVREGEPSRQSARAGACSR